jgi:hypothetical protein
LQDKEMPRAVPSHRATIAPVFAVAYIPAPTPHENAARLVLAKRLDGVSPFLAQHQ